MSSPFKNPTSLRAAFNRGLENLLDHATIETFILVLANASNDPDFYAAIRSRIEQGFENLKQQLLDSRERQEPLQVVAEDLQIFEKLMHIGLDNIQHTQQRDIGPWQLKYNQLRSFRPRRISQQTFSGLSRELNRDGFHFNKPFLQKECFWQGELHGKPVDLYYNKFPFADCHGLLVIDREAWQNQYLTQSVHDYLFALTRDLGNDLPDIGFGYNSIGAFASVNHLHFQMFLGAGDCAVTQDQWRHRGGNADYPVSCYFENDSNKAWQRISEWHQQQQPYNLLYTADGVYLLPRKEQNSVPVPTWSSGCTWYELAGALVVFDQDAYHQLGSEDIHQVLSELDVER